MDACSFTRTLLFQLHPLHLRWELCVGEGGQGGTRSLSHSGAACSWYQDAAHLTLSTLFGVHAEPGTQGSGLLPAPGSGGGSEGRGTGQAQRPAEDPLSFHPLLPLFVLPS